MKRKPYHALSDLKSLVEYSFFDICDDFELLGRIVWRRDHRFRVYNLQFDEFFWIWEYLVDDFFFNFRWENIGRLNILGIWVLRYLKPYC